MAVLRHVLDARPRLGLGDGLSDARLHIGEPGVLVAADLLDTNDESTPPIRLPLFTRRGLGMVRIGRKRMGHGHGGDSKGTGHS